MDENDIDDTNDGSTGDPELAAHDEISTAECSTLEIACARAEGRLRVSPNGLGFIRMLASDPRVPFVKDGRIDDAMASSVAQDELQLETSAQNNDEAPFERAVREWQDRKAAELPCSLRSVVEQLGAMGGSYDRHLLPLLRLSAMGAYHQHQGPSELPPGAIDDPRLVFNIERGTVRNHVQHGIESEMVLQLEPDIVRMFWEWMRNASPGTFRAFVEAEQRDRQAGGEPHPQPTTPQPVSGCRTCGAHPRGLVTADGTPVGWLRLGYDPAAGHTPVELCDRCVALVKRVSG